VPCQTFSAALYRVAESLRASSAPAQNVLLGQVLAQKLLRFAIGISRDKSD
jgi:hypothetical protein